MGLDIVQIRGEIGISRLRDEGIMRESEVDWQRVSRGSPGKQRFYVDYLCVLGVFALKFFVEAR